MKKIFAILMSLTLLLSTPLSVLAQDEAEASGETTEVNDSAAKAAEAAAAEEKAAKDAEEAEKKEPVKQEEKNVLKEKFIEGGAFFMSFPLICLILGLAIAIERIITLLMSRNDNKKLIQDVESALASGGVDKATSICRETKGPVASIFYQGLSRSSQGLGQVEKSLVDYGSVQANLLEKGLVWLSLFIALAPMLGFMGTVIGMIDAFDDIQNAGEISAEIVAGGIKVALLTTVAGLIVAMILQLFYNLILSMVDSLTSEMEDSSIELVDMLIKHNVVSTKG